MGDILKIGGYILVFIPGFIFVQVIEHHLLREKINEIKKALDIILWSAILWVMAFLIPIGFGPRDTIISIINQACNDKKISEITDLLLVNKDDLIFFFLVVCGESFIFGNLYGIFRKNKQINSIFTFVTGRDWYPSASFRFYKENIDKAIEIKTKDHKYLGILYSAPDRVEDKYIIISEPYYIIENNGKRILEKIMLTEYILIKIEEIEEIRALEEKVLKKKEKKILKKEGRD